MSVTPLISIRDLTQEYVARGGLFGRTKQQVRVLDHFNLTIYKGETLGIVGESGCGKSTLANTLLRLIPAASGEVSYNDRNILHLKAEDLRQLRQHFQMVFQNPFTSLNPRLKVLDIIAEPLRTHLNLSQRDLKDRVSKLLRESGMSDDHLDRYPHELSGGQAQRVAVARALALNPKFLILDEPTSALDVSVQAQIINLLINLQKQHELTYLFISHDLGVVQHIADRIAVMYLGQVVELGPSEAVFANPQHPYTQALLSATPTPTTTKNSERIVLEGNVPSIANPPSGCRFHTRCPHVFDRCRIDIPTASMKGDDHWATCHLLES
ncbi:MAG: oligopeptide/dipeptide ABC transporter ATP-binding protein [Chloroflexota bacterium]